MIFEHIVRYVRSVSSPTLQQAQDTRRSEVAVDSATGEFKWYSVGDGAAQTAVDLAHTQTVTGPKTFSGTAAFTGATTGVRRAASITSADTIAVTAAASGTVYIATKDSATQVFTLPSAGTAGLQYSFVCGHASGEIHVGVTGSDNLIKGKTHGAENGTAISSTAETGLLKNTAATNVVGDFCTLVSDGSTTWWMVSVAGVWSAT